MQMAVKKGKLFYGGHILTVTDNHEVNAVLVEGDTILDVGEVNELRQKYGDQQLSLINLKGQTMIPGFIDAHSHFTQVAMGFFQLSLEKVTDFSEIKPLVDQFIKRNDIRKGDWIQANQYSFSPGKDQPTIEQLNSLSPDNPLIIQHKSGHFGLSNSRALKELGITSQTPEIAGGIIGKEENKLTGYLEENAYFTYAKKIPLPTVEQLKKAYQLAQDKYASYGITTIQEGMLVKQMIPLYQFLYQSDILKLDVVTYSDVETFSTIKEMVKGNTKNYINHIRVGGIKIFLDGSPQGRTAWMLTPYEDDSKYFGYGTMSDQEVEHAMEMAVENDVQLIAHCNGDAAAAQMIACLERVSFREPSVIKKRFVMIHGQLLQPSQMPKMRRLGMIVSFFVAHVFYWGDIYIKNFGLSRAKQISAAKSALDCGLDFTFHQDAPVIEPNMIETLWCAVNRETKEGISLGSEEQISIEAALKAVTINAAYQYGEEKRKGSIEPGKQADFVILDKNPLSVPSTLLRSINVTETIKLGETVFTHPQ